MAVLTMDARLSAVRHSNWDLFSIPWEASSGGGVGGGWIYISFQVATSFSPHDDTTVARRTSHKDLIYPFNGIHSSHAICIASTSRNVYPCLTFGRKPQSPQDSERNKHGAGGNGK